VPAVLPEATAFTGAALDRIGDGRRRDAGWLDGQRRHGAARAVLAGADGVHVRGEGEPRLALVPLGELDAGPAVLLGLDAAGPVFAVDADGLAAPLRTRVAGLREAAAILPRADGGLAAYAAALLNWHRRHAFCANCGARTDLAEGGLVRSCPACGAEHHPRTDPVVIMLVTDGARLLLGRQPSWPPRRYSALAGFVEPGESLEEAVLREVREEAGVVATAPRYVGSQPWPFPSSLMLGFTARWAGGEPRASDGELEDCRWFSRAEVSAAAAEDDDGWATVPRTGSTSAGPLWLPPRLAIARRLVEGWLGAGAA
jgi:NAD+ diphosphatase